MIKYNKLNFEKQYKTLHYKWKVDHIVGSKKELIKFRHVNIKKALELIRFYERGE